MTLLGDNYGELDTETGEYTPHPTEQEPIMCDICQRPILGEVFSPGKCHKECIKAEMV